MWKSSCRRWLHGTTRSTGGWSTRGCRWRWSRCTSIVIKIQTIVARMIRWCTSIRSTRGWCSFPYRRGPCSSRIRQFIIGHIGSRRQNIQSRTIFTTVTTSGSLQVSIHGCSVTNRIDTTVRHGWIGNITGKHAPMFLPGRGRTADNAFPFHKGRLINLGFVIVLCRTDFCCIKEMRR